MVECEVYGSDGTFKTVMFMTVTNKESLVSPVNYHGTGLRLFGNPVGKKLMFQHHSARRIFCRALVHGLICSTPNSTDKLEELLRVL